MSDPFPGNPVVQGTWRTMHGKLIWLGGNRVLEVTNNGGGYRLWNYDSSITGNADPFPGDPVTQGTWNTIDHSHDLVYLGGDRILDWVPRGVQVPYRIWHFNRNVTSGDPFPGAPIVSGTWDTGIRYGPLINLGRDRVLHYDKSTGGYEIYRYDRTVTGNGDPFGKPIVQGQWKTINDLHQLVALYGDRVLDYAQNKWDGSKSHYRIWRYARNVTFGDPLPGDPVVEGDWSSIGVGQLLYVGDNRVLESQNLLVGDVPYRIWNYARDGLYVGGQGDTFQISTGADGTTWAIDDAYRLWRWDTYRWVQPTDYAKGSQIAVGDANHVWHLNSIGQLWRWTGGGWQQSPNIAGINVDVGSDGEVWVIHPRGNLFRWTGVAWDQPTTYARGVQVAVGSASHVWHRNRIGEMWAWTGSGWNLMPGQALHLAVGADGTVCHVGLSNRVYRWVGGQWQEMPTNNRAAQVGVGNAGAIWYVDLDNHFFRWNGTAFDPIYNLPT